MSEEAQPAAAPQGQQVQFPTDAAALSTVYTNFCRVNVTPEELVLDFGLNPTLTPTPAEPIKLTHRVVMNFFTAKRLLNALYGVVTQHENAYGSLELDFQKRLRGGGQPQQPAARPAGGAPSPIRPAPGQ
ncbi:MAG: DUF3467 domain-containing protein [Planctomycetota bacterium]|nr:DUF3467 domain-containing protein [Planctomycetota bacterium]